MEEHTMQHNQTQEGSAMEYEELAKELEELMKERIELIRTLRYMKKAKKEKMQFKHRTANGHPLPNPEHRAEGLSNLQRVYGAFKHDQAKKERMMRGGIEPTQPSPSHKDCSVGLDQAPPQGPVRVCKDIERLQQEQGPSPPTTHTEINTTDSVGQGASKASEDKCWAPFRCAGRLLSRCRSILFNRGKDLKLKTTAGKESDGDPKSN